MAQLAANRLCDECRRAVAEERWGTMTGWSTYRW